MGNSSSRAVSILVSLIIGLAAGLWIGHTIGLRKAKTAALFGAHPVYIGPTEKIVNPPDQPISYRDNGVVYWKPWLAAGNTVAITFRAADFPPEANHEPPFIGGTPNTDQTIQCAGGSCFSYAINPNLEKYLRENPTKGLYYKYWQTLNNKTADARIIINW